MSLADLHSYQTRVERMFDAYSFLPENDEIRSNWTKHLCIQAAGVLEASVRTFLVEFARPKSEPRVLNFVEAQLAYFTNSSCEKIESLLATFSKHWSDEFTQTLTEQERDAINSIIGNRHIIAHGRDVGLTYVRIKTYYAHATKVLSRLQTMIAR